MLSLFFYFIYWQRSNWVRNWKLWQRYCAYFPIKLVKTVDLDPKKNYLFGSHPHGILCSGAFGNFATEGSNVSQVFPGITMHLLTLEGHYSLPFYREYVMCSGKNKHTTRTFWWLISLGKFFYCDHLCSLVILRNMFSFQRKYELFT